MTRLRGRLDHLLAAFVHRGLDSLEAPVLEVLRLGAYQCLYMDSVPAYAAVSASVEQVAAVGKRPAAGLVNAVLRKVADAGVDGIRFPAPDSDPEGYLTTWGSHPRWLIERWLARWTPEQVTALVEADNRKPPRYLTPLRRSAADAVAALAEAGLSAELVGKGASSVRLGLETSPVEALRVVPDAVVQDPAAHLVVEYADVPAGTKVADLCAAPGGKALALSTEAFYTLAADRSESRMQMVRENAERTQARLGMAVADAAHPPVSGVDVVLLDVPCSGTGTLARHPDARWRLTDSSIREMAGLQTRLLEAASTAVAPGGVLVYSTCTLEPEENEGVVDAFLSTRDDFQPAPSDAVPAEYLDDAGWLSVLPHVHGFDGSFAARLRRVA